MHARRLHYGRIEKLRNARKKRVGILAYEARQRRKALVLRGNDDGRGTRPGELRLVAGVAEKRDLVGPRALKRADLADQRMRVARDAAAEARGDLPERQRPRHLVTSPRACLPAP